MTKMKTIFAIIFLALLIPVLLKAPESEAKVYRGKYANNTQWSYDTKTKTIIIDCRGSLPDDLVIYVPKSKKAEYEKILRSTNGLDFHAKIVGKKW